MSQHAKPSAPLDGADLDALVCDTWRYELEERFTALAEHLNSLTGASLPSVQEDSAAGEVRDFVAAQVVKVIQRETLIRKLQAESLSEFARIHSAYDTARTTRPHMKAAVLSMAATIGTATGASTHGVRERIECASKIHASFPHTCEALHRGETSFDHAKEIVAAGEALSPAGREEFEKLALDEAKSTSPQALRRKLEGIAARVEPTSRKQNTENQVRNRSVTVKPVSSCMSLMTAHLPTDAAAAIDSRLNQIAAQLLGMDPSQTASPADSGKGSAPSGAGNGSQLSLSRKKQLARYKADAFSLLLTYGTVAADSPDAPALGTGVDPQLHVNVNLERLIDDSVDSDADDAEVVTASHSLLDRRNAPVEISGYGFVDSSLATKFAALSHRAWTMIGQDTTGQILGTGTYKPTAALKNYIKTRDRHCRFPGCVTNAEACEIDHTHEYGFGGTTTPENLGLLCPTHHFLKHPDLPDHIRWSVTQIREGPFQWISPLMQKYLVAPSRPPGKPQPSGNVRPSRVRFEEVPS